MLVSGLLACGKVVVSGLLACGKVVVSGLLACGKVLVSGLLACGKVLVSGLLACGKVLVSGLLACGTKMQQCSLGSVLFPEATARSAKRRLDGRFEINFWIHAVRNEVAVRIERLLWDRQNPQNVLVKLAGRSI